MKHVLNIPIEYVHAFNSLDPCSMCPISCRRDIIEGLFSDVSKADIYRRNLQKTYVSQLDELINPTSTSMSAASNLVRIGFPSADVENTDVVSEAKAQLKKLATSLQASKAITTDANALNHINDLQDRIKQALDPK